MDHMLRGQFRLRRRPGSSVQLESRVDELLDYYDTHVLPRLNHVVTTHWQTYSSRSISGHSRELEKSNIFGSLLADLGDMVPFAPALSPWPALWSDFDLSSQVEANGFPRPIEEMLLFDSHDYVLGLVHLFSITDPALDLSLLQSVRNTLEDAFETNWGFLRNNKSSLIDCRISRCSPYNLGFAELFFDVYEMTGKTEFRAAAVRWTEAYFYRTDFLETGKFVQRWEYFNQTLTWIRNWRSGRAGIQVFKDYTAASWAILAAHRTNPSETTERALAKIIQTIMAWSHATGLVPQFPTVQTGNHVLSSIYCSELLCDIAIEGVNRSKAVKTGKSILDTLLSSQLRNELLMADNLKRHTHVDVAIDFGIALWKLGRVLEDETYCEKACEQWLRALQSHLTDKGLILSVDSAGQIYDSQIIPKYQFLALKPFWLLRLGGDIESNRKLWLLVRDR